MARLTRLEILINNIELVVVNEMLKLQIRSFAVFTFHTACVDLPEDAIRL